MQSVFPQRALLTVETAMTNKQSGVTLIELVVTIVVLSIALVGLSFAISGGLRQTSNTLFEVRAIALAQSYLDEILSKKFDERSRNGGVPPCKNPLVMPTLSGRQCANPLLKEETLRTGFDDVDDYNGLDEGLNSLGGDPLLDAQGNARANYDNFRVEVSVRLIDTAANEQFAATSTPKPNDSYDAKLITVTVSNGDGAVIDFSSYKSNF